MVPRIESPPRMPIRGLKVFRGELRAAGDRDRDPDAPGGDLPDGLRDHPPRHGVDRRLAGGDGEARFRHRPHPFAGGEFHAVALGPGDRCRNQRPVRHVGVVARVLDDGRLRAAGRRPDVRERERDPRPAGKGDLHPLRDPALREEQDRRLRRRRGAAPGRVSAPERAHGFGSSSPAMISSFGISSRSCARASPIVSGRPSIGTPSCRFISYIKRET